MNVFQALGFMTLGGVIVGLFNALAWRKYYEGKREGFEQWKRTKGV